MKNENVRELIRFLICGLAAALTDYLFCQLVILIFNKSGVAISWIWLTTISTIIGFIFGVIVNYLLSTFWVYRNVDKNINTKSTKFISLFVLFSVIAALLSIGTMLLANVIVVYGFHEASIIDAFVSQLLVQPMIWLCVSVLYSFFCILSIIY